MKNWSAIGAAFLGMLAFVTTSHGDAEAAHARVKRVSAKGSQETARHARRRGGSTQAGGEKSATGEVVGGLGGHKLHKPVAARKAAAPSAAKTAGTSGKAARHGKVARVVTPPKLPCFHDAVEFERGFGGDQQLVVLTRCDGRPAPQAIEQLSVLVRPMNAPKPSVEATPIRHGASQREWLPGVKLVHEGLVARMQVIVDHFHPKKVTIVSGYRPTSLGSFHQSARAMDFHLDGVSNEVLVAFCRTLKDTGCGFYPNSSFVHMDVRAAGTGHVYWIDASGPGEPARYVAMWPPRDGAQRPAEIPRPDPAAPLDEQTHVDSRVHLAPGASDAKVDARTTAPLSAGDGKDDPFAP